MASKRRQQKLLATLGVALTMLWSPVRGQEEGRGTHVEEESVRSDHEDVRAREGVGEDVERAARGLDLTEAPNDRTRQDEKTGKTQEEQGLADVRIDSKIHEQIELRGWTELEIRELTRGEPNGTSVDNRKGRSDPAEVYGQPGRYVVVNKRSRDVIQISDKKGEWKDDRRIKWNHVNGN